MNSTFKSLLFWILIFSIVVLMIQAFKTGTGEQQELSFTEFLAAVEDDRIEEVTVRTRESGGELVGKYKPGRQLLDGQEEFKSQFPDYPELVPTLLEQGIMVKAEPAKENPMLAIFLTWGPVLLIVGLWIFFMRQFQNGGNKAMSFGKSRARLLNQTGKKVTFDDVSGVEEAKSELQEVVEFLKEPQKFQRLGGKIPKGVLLMGPPGTGKTLLARAIAGEANVPFFSISGSDFVEMFVGVGASRVRDLFDQGKKNAPCIIFIDEIDAVGRHRGAGLGGGHDEREQTLNQLLVEMDGFEANEGVILIAATNRPDVLDPALLRPGRFDRQVVVDLPDINGRVGILRVHTKAFPLSENVDLKTIARGTPGFAGADLANLVNEAALYAARKDKKKVEAEDFEFAKDKIMMGLERKSVMLTDEEKGVTAYHEAGHAIVAVFLTNTDPLHKVTIIPRGRALGLTVQLPTQDRYTHKQTFLENRIAVLMGGRVAEELTQSDVTNGAGSDIVRATSLARQMVCDWGMSTLGPLALGAKDEPVFLGREINQRVDYGDETATKIDHEVSRIVNDGYETARRILEENRELLERMAEDLLEHESLDAVELYALIEDVTGKDLMPEALREALREEEERKIEASKPKPKQQTEERPVDAGGDAGMPESLPSPA